jgi:hypothetical protein
VFMPRRMERKVSTTVRLHSKEEPNPQVSPFSQYVWLGMLIIPGQPDIALDSEGVCTVNKEERQHSLHSKRGAVHPRYRKPTGKHGLERIPIEHLRLHRDRLC